MRFALLILVLPGLLGQTQENVERLKEVDNARLDLRKLEAEVRLLPLQCLRLVALCAIDSSIAWFCLRVLAWVLAFVLRSESIPGLASLSLRPCVTPLLLRREQISSSLCCSIAS